MESERPGGRKQVRKGSCSSLNPTYIASSSTLSRKCADAHRKCALVLLLKKKKKKTLLGIVYALFPAIFIFIYLLNIYVMFTNMNNNSWLTKTSLSKRSKAKVKAEISKNVATLDTMNTCRSRYMHLVLFHCREIPKLTTHLASNPYD